MMKALIIEDETAAARNLAAILRQTAPDVEIVATLESVEESVEWLRSNPHPDLLFMDIHLADGDSFRIFDAVEIAAPVIFTTAYDQYARAVIAALNRREAVQLGQRTADVRSVERLGEGVDDPPGRRRFVPHLRRRGDRSPGDLHDGLRPVCTRSFQGQQHRPPSKP